MEISLNEKVLFVDFHLHSFYYPGASRKCTLENIARIAKLKGLHIVGTGDALHPKWRETLRRTLVWNGDIYIHENGTYFLPTAEVKLNTYVHSVIVLPTLECFDELYDILKKYGKLDATGVPFVYISGKEIVEIVNELGGFLFIAHPFTPFQSFYVKYKQLSEYFGNKEKEIFCIEITPSVDNLMAEKVKDINSKTFLSNSDAHSPIHLGREFNLIFGAPTFSSIFKAIRHNRVINYEMPPSLGKYYMTACKNCGFFYHYQDAKILNFRCENCKKPLWIGTRDRIKFLLENGACSLEHKFVRHIPLDLIIKHILGINNPEEETLKIIAKYREIELLHFLDLEKIEIPEKLKNAIKIVREGRYFIYPGGGWRDGKILLEKPQVVYYSRKQQALFYENKTGGEFHE